MRRAMSEIPSDIKMYGGSIHICKFEGRVP
jgi:hypothetical protein